MIASQARSRSKITWDLDESSKLEVEKVLHIKSPVKPPGTVRIGEKIHFKFEKFQDPFPW
jgi:hypothetical protein